MNSDGNNNAYIRISNGTPKGLESKIKLDQNDEEASLWSDCNMTSDGISDTKVHLFESENDTAPAKKIVIEQEKGDHPPDDDPDEFWSDDEDEDDEEAKESNIVAKVIITLQQTFFRSFAWLREKTGGYFISAIVLVAYSVYFVAAMAHEFGTEPSLRLLFCTILGLIILLRHHASRGVRRLARNIYGRDKLTRTAEKRLSCFRFFLRWAMYGLLSGLVAWTLYSHGMKDPNSLRSVPGLILFCLICLLCSTNPAKVNWHTIFWGVGLQFLCALLVLKFEFGRNSILWIQSRLDEFFANAKAGSKMMFGETYEDHYMVFAALPLIFLSNATLTALYYTGAVPLLIRTIGSFLSFVLETSPVENMSVAAGIFLEGVTAILTLRPYLAKMSKSQLFLTITSAFASLGGAYLAILSSMQVPLSYLIPAMVVSAPATFVVCKLIVPETKLKREHMKAPAGVEAEEAKKYAGLFDAAQTGAISMIPLVANIVVSAFIFFAYIEWFNHTVEWFGNRVGIDGLSIESISAVVFYPVALAIGIEPVDCGRAGLLLGYRTVVTNLVSFMKMLEMKQNKHQYEMYMTATNGTGPVTYINDDIILDGWNKTLKSGFLQDRSEAIITYALCGFSSALTVVITMGIMITLVPNRKAWITRISLIALLAGNIANCMTGCFASIFY